MRLKLYEEYINSQSNRITTLFTNMIKMFQDTFNGNNDILSDSETSVLTLVEIEKSTSNDAFEKNLLLNFNDTEYYYQVIFVIKLEDVKDTIENGYIKIKIYDADAKLIKEWQSNLKIQESTDDEISAEGRFFVKVQPFQVKEGEEETFGDFEYIENFLISKIGDLKEVL